MTPAHHLWRAVLLDAITVATGRGAATDAERRAARVWIAADRDDVGSFVWCCTLFRLEPTAVRRALRERPTMREAA